MKSRVNNTRTLAKVYFIYYNNIISVKSVFALEQKQLFSILQPHRNESIIYG